MDDFNKKSKEQKAGNIKKSIYGIGLECHSIKCAMDREEDPVALAKVLHQLTYTISQPLMDDMKDMEETHKEKLYPHLYAIYEQVKASSELVFSEEEIDPETELDQLAALMCSTEKFCEAAKQVDLFNRTNLLKNMEACMPKVRSSAWEGVVSLREQPAPTQVIQAAPTHDQVV